MQMCWAGHPGTTEQPTCCIRCSPINKISLAGLPLPRRFKKAALLEGESFDFYTIQKESWYHTKLSDGKVLVLELVDPFYCIYSWLHSYLERQNLLGTQL